MNSFSDGTDIAPYQVMERTVQCKDLQNEGTCTSSLRGLFQFQNLNIVLLSVLMHS